MKARVRWLTNVAFQIDCCSKTVITDPCLEKTAYQGFHADSFVNVDYVVLSHVHWDHIYDLKAMVAKYSPKIFVGALSAYETALYCDSNPSYVYPMFPNQDVVVDGMNIKCIATRHLVLPSKAQSQVERGAKADFFPDRPGMGRQRQGIGPEGDAGNQHGQKQHAHPDARRRLQQAGRPGLR